MIFVIPIAQAHLHLNMQLRILRSRRHANAPMRGGIARAMRHRGVLFCYGQECRRRGKTPSGLNCFNRQLTLLPHSPLRKFLNRKLMISNCKLDRINKRISIFPCLPAGRGCCYEELWKKDADAMMRVFTYRGVLFYYGHERRRSKPWQ